MGVSWTKEQQKVIDLRNRNILVSAAAGSGKTAVLVERIIKIITDREHPVDIDHLLVVTFTNAAAAEMRERVGNAIEKALDENPGDEHLLRQLTLIHNAQITTIDSFCLYVVRNHFHEIDLEPGFRIGDEGELKLLREDVLRKVLEKNYEEPTEHFCAFVEGYASGRTDEALNEMVFGLYEFSRSYPWPKKWLDSCGESYAVESEEALNDAEWMEPVTEHIRAVLKDLITLTDRAAKIAEEPDGPQMYVKNLLEDRDLYEQAAALSSFTELYEMLVNFKYGRLASSRGFDGDPEKLELVKNLRDEGKDTVKKLCRQFFFCSPGQMVEQLKKTEPMLQELVRLTEQFADEFALAKRTKNLVDFHDLEHFALEILVDEETETAKKTAEEFRDTFEEIMIDEYQDSNQVQETLLRAVSREERGENNFFMVGDVKQSIYRFRLARPELFMKKYDSYTLEDSTTQRIDLHKNFRSREEVLGFTNDIFYKIMAKNLGNVVYDSEAALYPGASYEKAGNGMFAPEILLVDTEDELLEDSQYSDKKTLEAKLVAEKIKRLKREQLVTDKATGELRPVRYSDIVILLRSLSGWADELVNVLNESNIPAHTISATGYFVTVEVQTVLAMLRILDNPRQDIPLAAVLRSPIAGLSDEELALLKLNGEDGAFHEAVIGLARKLSEEEDGQQEAKTQQDGDTREKEPVQKTAGMSGAGEAAETDQKIRKAEQKLLVFYKLYMRLRKLVPDTPIHELIRILLQETGYGDYAAAMPAGRRRRANLNMLLEKAAAYENTSYKGLFHFVRYIDELQKYDVDFGEADLTGENEDVVRIMSIHKSKGLEFPVVIVAGCGKQFNRQDTRNKMVLHPELGIGLDYIDGERRVKSPTIAKKAVAGQIELENLGEELRVLYVALTRAKEKLILTGSMKHVGEKLAYYSSHVTGQEGELPYLQREQADSYLEWILPAIFACGDKYPVTVVEAAELVLEEVEHQTGQFDRLEQRMEEIEHADEGLVMQLSTRFAQTYPYQTDMQRKNKYSVSELKHRAMRELFEREQEDAVPVFAEEVEDSVVPRFMQETESASEINAGALRGTAVHRVMECYHFSGEKSAADQITDMEAAGKIDRDMSRLVKRAAVEQFVHSATGARMAAAEAAGKLYRERPFVMGFTAEQMGQYEFGTTMKPAVQQENPLTENTKTSADSKQKGKAADDPAREEDLTLIQGIIDVFWLEPDGIVLLDYKTDRVQTAEQLKDRYAAQLHLYAEALERVFAATGLKVKEILIYSFYLEEVLRL